MRKPARELPKAPPPAPEPGTSKCRISLTPSVGTLPDTPAELLAIVNAPASIAQAQAAIEKMGQLYDQDLTDEMSFHSAEEFNPLVTTLGIGSNAAAIRAFALHVIPLRKALGRQFGAGSPAIHMLVDLAALAYWRCLQTEHAIVAHLAGALENPYFIQRASQLEKIKHLATKQLVSVLDALGVATGRAIHMDPEAGAARLLRFREGGRTNAHGKRLRRASAG